MKKAKCNPHDIVGKTIGPYKVSKYLGAEQKYASNIKPNGNKIHMYELVCTKCGYVRKPVERCAVLHPHTQCKRCSLLVIQQNIDREKLFSETLVEALEDNRQNKKALSTNVSTGIKRYSISKQKRGYVHQVRFQIDGVIYQLAYKQGRDLDELIPEFVELANEDNEVMSHGKEYFKWWYENIFKKNSK